VVATAPEVTLSSSAHVVPRGTEGYLGLLGRDEGGGTVFPRLKTPDSSIGLLREGYTFISRRCDRLGTDGFRTRLMLSPATCIRGAQAARLFCSGDRFTRQGAFPKSVVRLLQDEGSVQTLDGAAHRHRKAMFLSTLQGEDPMDLEGIFERGWHAASLRWQQKERVVLHDEMEELLTRTSAAWSGVPMSERDVRLRTRELSAMVENAGTFGPSNWRARILRNRSELWARGLVARVRAGDLRPPDASFLAVLAAHREPDGRELGLEVAGVELLNVLRPIVAVSRFVAFAALALLRQPRWQDAFAAGEEDDLRGFVDEVRRLYPFFPLIGGRARKPFSWPGCHDFAEGEWVLLDLYGTNHDERLWDHPEAFRPERFRNRPGDPYALIPQGAGEYAEDHRCPGEPITIRLMTQAVRLLTRGMRYRVGVQDFSISLHFMPAKPKDGFVIHDVRPHALGASLLR
jgi:fatty-acid peroxygenase